MVRGRKTSIRIELDEEQRQELESWLRATTGPAGLARRARIILMLASGESVSQISRTIGIGRNHVAKWAKRFIEQGIRGLDDKAGRGRKPSGSVGKAAKKARQKAANKQTASRRRGASRGNK